MINNIDMPGLQRSLAPETPDAAIEPLVTAAPQRLLVHATVLGVVGKLSLDAGIDGPGLVLWVLLLGLSLTRVVWSEQRNLPRETAAWLTIAVVFAGALAWRDAEMIKMLDVIAVLGALAFAAMSMRERATALFANRARDVLRSAREVVLVTITGLLPLLRPTRRQVTTPREAWIERARPAIRATVIAGAITVVFGALLGNADPIFASFFDFPGIDVGSIVQTIFVTSALGWIAAGWHRAAMDEVPTRGSAPVPWVLARADIVAALGALNVLFAVYVLAQLGWLVGGESFLHDRTGLTAAEYARRGFFEMAWIVALVLPVLLASRAMLEPRIELERLHTRLSAPVVLLLLFMVGTAAARMRLYIHYYGFTLDRVYTMVFMGWLMFVVSSVALTVLRGDGRRFVRLATASALCVLTAINVVSLDALVARANLARAARSPALPVDLSHLASLSGEAVGVAIAAVTSANGAVSETAAAREERCSAARHLLSQWGPTSFAKVAGDEEGSWRVWNAGRSRGVAAVAARTRELRAVVHSACAKSPSPATS